MASPENIDQRIAEVVLSRAQAIDPVNRISEFSVNQANKVGVMEFVAAKTALRRGPYVRNPETGFQYQEYSDKWGRKRKVKTPLMRETETKFALPGEALGDLLHRLYWKESKSSREVADILQISPAAISDWYLAFQMPTRNQQEAAIIKWGNEHKKTRLVLRTQSPEAKNKRSKSYEDWRQEHPDEFNMLTEEHRTRIAQTVEKRRGMLYGENPEARLRELLVDQRLSFSDAAAIIGESDRSVWLRVKNIPAIQADRRRPLDPRRRERAAEFGRLKEGVENFAEYLTEREVQVHDSLYPIGGVARSLEEARIELERQGIKMSRIRVGQLDKSAFKKIKKLIG